MTNANGLDFLMNPPLEWLMGNPFYHNLKVLLILTLNGFCFYFLALYLFKSRGAAFVAGLLADVGRLPAGPMCNHDMRDAEDLVPSMPSRQAEKRVHTHYQTQ